LAFIRSKSKKKGGEESMTGPKYLNEVMVAELTGRALSTLRNERAMGQGIPYIKIGRSVRYDLEDIVSFMESRKIRTRDVNE